MDSFLATLPAIALALFLALRGGRRAQRLGIPRVTAYLLVGILLGPHALGRLVGEESALRALLLDEHTHDVLAVAKQLALGFILFRVGCEFRFTALRRVGPRVLVVSLCEVLATAGAVFVAVFALTGDLAMSALAPLLATDSAPSATLLTLREVEAEGPASQALIQLVGLNNLVTLLLFPLVLVLAYGAGQPWIATGAALLALAGGVALGFLAAVSLESSRQARERMVLGLLLVFACLGLAHALGGAQPFGAIMLACFGAGVAMTNGSHFSDQLGDTLESAVYPLYVLFFLGAGSALEIETLLGLGLLGLFFVGARSAGKVLGARLGVRLARWSGELSPWLGAGLLSQAGVALGLIAALEVAAPAETADLRHVALGSVVFFELLGPILTRNTVVRAGEVKLSNLMLVGDAGGRRALREVAGELGQNLGLVDFGRIDARGGLTVRHAMHKAPDVARANTLFEDVLKLLSHTSSDLLPVIDADGSLLGLISFNDMKDILYDPHLRGLVIAEDLAQPVSEPLDPEEPLHEALADMDRMRVHSWPVVEDGVLVGMLKRKDVYSTLHRTFRSTRRRAEPRP